MMVYFREIPFYGPTIQVGREINSNLPRKKITYRFSKIYHSIPYISYIFPIYFPNIVMLNAQINFSHHLRVWDIDIFGCRWSCRYALWLCWKSAWKVMTWVQWVFCASSVDLICFNKDMAEFVIVFFLLWVDQCGSNKNKHVHGIITS